MVADHQGVRHQGGVNPVEPLGNDPLGAWTGAVRLIPMGAGTGGMVPMAAVARRVPMDVGIGSIVAANIGGPYVRLAWSGGAQHHE